MYIKKSLFCVAKVEAIERYVYIPDSYGMDFFCFFGEKLSFTKDKVGKGGGVFGVFFSHNFFPLFFLKYET